jgi:hypothetical protein
VADLADLGRAVAKRRGIPKRVVALTLPGGAAKAMRSGALTAGPGARIAGPTFEEWLAGEDVMAVPKKL